MASPRDFPVLATQRDRQPRRGYPARPYHTCRCCGLTVSPRNSNRHTKKCMRLKREDPALWYLWKMDMHGYTVHDIRKRLGPKMCAELVARGHLVQGPVRKDGSL